MKTDRIGVLRIILFAMIMVAGMSQSKSAYASITSVELVSVGVGAVLEGTVEIEEEELVELIEIKEKELAKENLVNNLVIADVQNLVNVRSEPSADSEAVGVLYQDCGGEILEQVDGWTKIVSGDLIGWVNNDYLLFGEAAAEEIQKAGRYIAIVDADALRVRKDMSEDAGIYGLVAQGERVEVIEETDEWIAIEYEGNIGYLSASYLEVEFEIDHGETMEAIEERERAEAEAKAALQQMNDAVIANTSDLDLLAALIYCEAGGESYEGQLAVASVVMNRVRSAAYPNTISGVIYASGQFTPAANGKVAQRVALGSPASCYQAAQEALNGVSNIGTYTRFRRAGTIDGYVIGNHVFY